MEMGLNLDYTCNTVMPANEPRETAKSILECIDGILNELSNELRRIDTSINSTGPVVEGPSEHPDECLLATLCRQRETAERLLKTAVHIREGLW